MKRLFNLFSLIVILVLFSSFQLLNGYYDFSKLYGSEQQYKTKIVADNSSSVGSYTELLLSKNQHILSLFRELKKAIVTDTNRFHYLHADADCNKSSIIKPLIQESLGEDYGFLSLRRDVIESTDIFNISSKYDDLYINELPFFTADDGMVASLLEFVQMEDGTLPNFIFIDDFDEIHPESGMQLVKNLKKYFITNTSNTKVIILGSPETLLELYQDVDLRNINGVKLNAI